MMLLSLFFLSSLASVAYSQDLNEADFVHNPQATAINGDSIKVEFYSTLEASEDYQELLVLRPLVMRMHGSAIEFDPRVVVTPGVDIQCRQPGGDNGAIDPLPSHCEEHCIASGQYCDMEDVEGIPSQPSSFAIEKMDGVHHIHELVSRRCVWLNYGESQPALYFQYFDSMNGGSHPCFHHLSPNCFHRTYVAIGIDLETMETCTRMANGTGGVPILEQALKQTMPSDLPALFVNGREVAEHHMTALQNLEYVCTAFDEKDMANKPLICEFCLAHCPEKAETSNIATCLWELKCEDDSTFNQFLEQKGIAVEHPEETEAPAATTETETATETEEPVATTTSTSSTTTEASSSSKEKKAEKGLGIFLTMLVALCGLFAFMVAVYAVRIQRSRAVIDKYLKAKAELEVMTSPGGHHDHEYFPTEGAMEGSDSLMMDLDGDIPQYSDQLTGMSQRGCTAAPKSSSFLPEIQ